MERIYYGINESGAKTANDMMSFNDYKQGSRTAGYQQQVNAAYDLADKIAELKPDQAERVYSMAAGYSKRMADYTNRDISIGLMCPSVMICGAGNFPVKKKEKQNAAWEKNMEFYNETQGILKKIENVLYGKGQILSGDEDAIQKLEEKLELLKESQEKMKNVNAYYRKNGTLEGCTELSEKEILEVKAAMARSWSRNDKPFASYELSNNNQNIRSVENRLNRLKAAKEKGTQEEECEFCKIVENAECMRLQLFFDDKPESEVRDILKKNGFRWAPSQSAWQRQLTNNARYALKSVQEELKKLKEA